jgi:hypothetical protein
MAQLLIKNFPESSGAHDYQLDDIVTVAEDSHEWGADELNLALFRIVNIPGARADFEYTLINERGGLRDIYPRSMLRDTKLIHSMRIEARNAPIKQQRIYRVNGLNQIERKKLTEN